MGTQRQFEFLHRVLEELVWGTEGGEETDGGKTRNKKEKAKKTKGMCALSSGLTVTLNITLYHMMCCLCRREEGAETREEGSQERQVEEGNWRRRRRRRRGRRERRERRWRRRGRRGRERKRGEGVTTGRGGPSLDRAASLSDDVLTYSLSMHDLHPLYTTSTLHTELYVTCIVTIATQNLIALCITIL